MRPILFETQTLYSTEHLVEHLSRVYKFTQVWLGGVTNCRGLTSVCFHSLGFGSTPETASFLTFQNSDFNIRTFVLHFSSDITANICCPTSPKNKFRVFFESSTLSQRVRSVCFSGVSGGGRI